MTDIFIFDEFFYVRDLTLFEKKCQHNESEPITNDPPETIPDEFSGAQDSDCEGGYKFNTKTPKSYNKQTVVTLFGRLKDGTSAAIHVIDYTTYFYLKVPCELSPEKYIEEFRKWMFQLSISIPQHHRGSGKIKIEVVKMISAHGFTNNEEVPFLKLSFNNLNTRKYYTNALNKAGTLGNHKVETFEAKCYPYMRFLHDRDIQPVSWINVSSFSNVPREYKLTRCQVEIVCRYMTISPSKTTTQPLLSVMSFDIETAPLVSNAYHPVKELGDPIIAMPVSFKIGNKIYNYVPIYLHATQPEDGAYTVIPCKTEYEMLKIFIKLLRDGPPDAPDKSPDVFLQFNGNTYDWPYIIYRMQQNDLFEEFSRCSKFLNYPKKQKEINLESSGLGANKFIYMDYPGTVNIDLLAYFKKQNDVTLPDLKLETIASAYLVKKDDRDMFLKSVDGMIEHLQNPEKEINEFLKSVIESHGGIDSLKEELKKENNYVRLLKIIYEAHQKKASNQKQKYDLKYETMYAYVREAETLTDENIVAEKINEIAKYSIQDCVLLHNLDSQKNIVRSTYTTANYSYITWKTYLTCGTGIPIFSVVTKFAKQYNKVFIDTQFNKREYDQLFEDEIRKEDSEVAEKYRDILVDYDDEVKKNQAINKLKVEFYKFGVIAGGYVATPVPGTHYNVATFDVNSEYPSIMMTHNLSHDTLVREEKYRNIDGITYNDIEWVTVDGKKHISTFVCDYKNRKPEDQGILPMVLQYLINKRLEIKGMLKDPNISSVTVQTLDAEQNAIKILCNSVYGTTVDKKSRLSCMDIGGCTTAKSRAYIMHAAELIKETFSNASIVYGDTDSVFIKFTHNDLSKEEAFKLAWDQSVQAEKIINDYMQNVCLYKYMKIEFEKLFSLLYLYNKKKKYFGKKHTKPPNINKFESISMGVKYKKRDSSMIEKFIGFVVEQHVLAERYEMLYGIISSCILLIRSGYFGPEYFRKHCKYNPPYDYPNRVMGAVIYELVKKLDPGNCPSIGQRIPYTYLYSPDQAGKSLYKCKKTEIAFPWDYLSMTEYPIYYLLFLIHALKSVKPVLQAIDNEKYQLLESYIKKLYGIRSLGA